MNTSKRSLNTIISPLNGFVHSVLLLLSGWPLTPSEAAGTSPEPEHSFVQVPTVSSSQLHDLRLNGWYLCGERLLKMHGKVGEGSKRLPELYRKHSVDRSEPFLELLFTVMSVESGFDRHAVSSAGARGLLQLMPVAVREAMVRCNLRALKHPLELHDSVTNVRYGSCFLRAMLDDSGQRLDRALILYNGGYSELAKHIRNESLSNETSNYLLKVRRNLKICRGGITK